jgi:hypothetical protein
VRWKNNESREKTYKLMVGSVILNSWSVNRKEKELVKEGKQKSCFGEGGSTSHGRNEHRQTSWGMMTLDKCKCERPTFSGNFVKGTRYGKKFEKFWDVESKSFY